MSFKEKLFNKVTSRKFLVCLGILSFGIAIYLGADGAAIEKAIGAAASTISSIVYIISEAIVDSKNKIDNIK